MLKHLSCVISFVVVSSLALGQVGALTTIGTTTARMGGIAFNSSGTLYGATSTSTGGSLYTINTSTGAATLVGPLVGASNASLTYSITGLAFQPGTGTLFGSTSQNSPNSARSLVTINPANGQVTVVGSFGVSGQTAADLTFSGSTLYGWLEASTDALVSINTSTGQATIVGSTGNSTFGSGIAANSSGTIFFAGKGVPGELWTLNATTGVHTVAGNLSGGPGASDAISAMAFSPSGVLFAINGGDDSSVWTLVTINSGAAPPGIPGTPIPSTWMLSAIGLAGIAAFQLWRKVARAWC